MKMTEQAISLIKELHKRITMTPSAINDFLGYDNTPEIAKIMARKYDESWDGILQKALCHPAMKELEQGGYIGQSETRGELPRIPVITYILTEKGLEFANQLR